MAKASNRNQVFDKINKKNKRNDSKEDVASNSNINGNVDSNVRDDIKGDGNINGNVTISAKKEEKHIKRTYYIHKHQDKNITKLARKTDRDKSEIIRMAIDYFLDNVIVE